MGTEITIKLTLAELKALQDAVISSTGNYEGLSEDEQRALGGQRFFDALERASRKVFRAGKGKV